MTATEQKWAERVESWRESGLTSEQYSDGRGFSANGLRHWAYKLGKTERRRPTVEVPEVRIVRVRASDGGGRSGGGGPGAGGDVDGDTGQDAHACPGDAVGSSAAGGGDSADAGIDGGVERAHAR